jgi:large subunit ribosomal protein L5
MSFFETFNNKIIKHDLINKYAYKNTKSIPKIKKITLNFDNCANFNIQKFATTILALEIIALKKSSITTSESPNISLKIQKGQPVGCKVTLTKKNIHQFLNRLILTILPKLANFSGIKIKTKTSTLSCKLLNKEIILKELDNHYPLFANLPNLNIQISTTTESHNELLFLIKSIKLPIYKKILNKT